MKIHCDGSGLKLAIEHALEEMDADETEGFDYPIGKVRGMTLRIVCEPDNGCFETTVIKSGMTYTAVT